MLTFAQFVTKLCMFDKLIIIESHRILCHATHYLKASFVWSFILTAFQRSKHVQGLRQCLSI